MLRKKLNQLGIGIIASLVLAFCIIPSALASVYGGGNYGACSYGNGCSTSSSSPSSSSSSSTTPSTPIVLNDYSDYSTDNGKTLDLSANQVVYFDVTSGGQTVRDSITIKQVGDGFIIIVISGIPNDVKLVLGETRQFDVNGDGQNDIEITLVSISGGKAKITFKQVVLGASTTNPTPSSTVALAGHKSKLGLFLSIAAIIAALIIFFWLWRRRKQRDRNSMNID